MRYIAIVFVLAAAIFFPQAVAAQSSPPTASDTATTVDYCFRIENLTDFPDYIFMAYFDETNVPPYMVLTPNNCIPVARGEAATLYATAREDFDEAEIGEVGAAAYFESGDLIATGVPLSYPTSVRVTDDTQKIIDIFSVQSVEETVDMNQADRQLIGADGTPRSVAVTSPVATIQPTAPVQQRTAGRGFAWLQENWIVAAPVAGSIIIGLIIVIGIARKRPTEAVVEQPPDEETPSV